MHRLKLFAAATCLLTGWATIATAQPMGRGPDTPDRQRGPAARPDDPDNERSAPRGPRAQRPRRFADRGDQPGARFAQRFGRDGAEPRGDQGLAARRHGHHHARHHRRHHHRHADGPGAHAQANPHAFAPRGDFHRGHAPGRQAYGAQRHPGPQDRFSAQRDSGPQGRPSPQAPFGRGGPRDRFGPGPSFGQRGMPGPQGGFGRGAPHGPMAAPDGFARRDGFAPRGLNNPRRFQGRAWQDGPDRRSPADQPRRRFGPRDDGDGPRRPGSSL